MPIIVEEGDDIYVFSGIQFPCAMRKRRGSYGKYVLVGRCLISSLMNGEAMKLLGVESVSISLE